MHFGIAMPTIREVSSTKGHMLESLEDRRLYSVSHAGKVLSIVGTTRSDNIGIAAGKGQIVVHDNGLQQTFNVGAVKTIRINGGRGDDLIIVSPRVAIRVSIEAGPGNDRVGGGARDDTIFGQQGNDTIVGNAGSDYFDAGPNDDYLEDTLSAVFHGGSGTDTARSRFTPIRSGIEQLIVPEGEIDTDNEIRVRDGRLIFQYTYISGGTADVVTFSGPTAGDNGTSVIGIRETIFGGGALISPHSHTWDVTGTDATGLVLTYQNNDPSNMISYNPIFLPR
ncbi:MAG TPA: hypothetical protein VF624_07390 [Tepidisphaeraceae bacterium]